MVEIFNATEPVDGDEITPRRVFSDAAMRALAEADERRQLREKVANAEAARQEVGGRTGPDPVRYGDWERNGLISDF